MRTRASGAAPSLASGTKVCPKNVDPAGAIQLYKMASATDYLKSVLLPWGTK